MPMPLQRDTASIPMGMQACCCPGGKGNENEDAEAGDAHTRRVRGADDVRCACRGAKGEARCRSGVRSAHPVDPAQHVGRRASDRGRSEEHTSELQSLMRISYAVFCLKKQSSNGSITAQNADTKQQE